ncbi:MAG: plastocyanin/azurin family copper-binding protein [Methylophaga sp.]|nr:plastocyanin/azurin family copper-binding protein [Methylophaga sp.]
MRSHAQTLSWIALFSIYPFTNAFSQTIEVTASGISFEPKVIAIEPGDTVRWTGMAGHSTALITKLSPNGVMKWDSPVGSNFENTFTDEGIYIYQCKPHSNLGMAGAVIVGEPVNLNEIKNSPQDKTFEKIINEAIKFVETNHISEKPPE